VDLHTHVLKPHHDRVDLHTHRRTHTVASERQSKYPHTTTPLRPLTLLRSGLRRTTPTHTTSPSQNSPEHSIEDYYTTRHASRRRRCSPSPSPWPPG
jgi:hypothetical protein